MCKISDIVLANLITVGLVMIVGNIVTIEVKRELFLNGRSNTFYNLKFF
jgi:hypothetical protein